MTSQQPAASGVPDDFDAAWYRETYPDVDLSGVDPVEHYQRIGRLLGRPASIKPRQLKRIVLTVVDLTTIGGIPSRTKRLLAHRHDRSVEYVALTARADNDFDVDGALCYAREPERVMAEFQSWTPEDTVFVLSNNSVRLFPPEIRNRIFEFPIIYISAGQMAFMVQDSSILQDEFYLTQMRAMHIISLSSGDIAFQRQLGIHGQVQGFVPIEQRLVNEFRPSRNRRAGYVGRIDFHAKDCFRLIDIARSLRGSQWGPLMINTTDGRNSPDFMRFKRMIKDFDLEDDVRFVMNCTDKDRIFRYMGVMILPSRKEAFGNAVVEALSYGVPVIAARYAPGPADIIEDEVSGFLLDDFTGSEVLARLDSLTPDRLAQMSNAAFQRHKRYRVDDHMQQLEDLALDAVQRFTGKNLLPVFPKLKLVDKRPRNV